MAFRPLLVLLALAVPSIDAYPEAWFAAFARSSSAISVLILNTTHVALSWPPSGSTNFSVRVRSSTNQVQLIELPTPEVTLAYADGQSYSVGVFANRSAVYWLNFTAPTIVTATQSGQWVSTRVWSGSAPPCASSLVDFSSSSVVLSTSVSVRGLVFSTSGGGINLASGAAIDLVAPTAGAPGAAVGPAGCAWNLLQIFLNEFVDPGSSSSPIDVRFYESAVATITWPSLPAGAPFLVELTLLSDPTRSPPSLLTSDRAAHMALPVAGAAYTVTVTSTQRWSRNFTSPTFIEAVRNGTWASARVWDEDRLPCGNDFVSLPPAAAVDLQGNVAVRTLAIDLEASVVLTPGTSISFFTEEQAIASTTYSGLPNCMTLPETTASPPASTMPPPTASDRSSSSSGGSMLPIAAGVAGGGFLLLLLVALLAVRRRRSRRKLVRSKAHAANANFSLRAAGHSGGVPQDWDPTFYSMSDTSAERGTGIYVTEDLYEVPVAYASPSAYEVPMVYAAASASQATYARPTDYVDLLAYEVPVAYASRAESSDPAMYVSPTGYASPAGLHTHTTEQGYEIPTFPGRSLQPLSRTDEDMLVSSGPANTVAARRVGDEDSIAAPSRQVTVRVAGHEYQYAEALDEAVPHKRPGDYIQVYAPGQPFTESIM